MGEAPTGAERVAAAAPAMGFWGGGDLRSLRGSPNLTCANSFSFTFLFTFE